jgi:hypothetical protein
MAITRKELLILLKLRQLEKLLLHKLFDQFEIYKKTKKQVDKTMVKQHILLLHAIDMLKTLDHDATGVVIPQTEVEDLPEEDYVLYSKGEKNES